MANAQSQQEMKLEIKQICPAPRERVFRARREAKNLGIWFHPLGNRRARQAQSRVDELFTAT